MTSESEIQHAILLRWGSHPRMRLARTNTGAAKVKGRFVRFGIPGQPDIQGLISPSGRYIGIEVKTKTGKQSDAQKTFQRVVESLGGIFILARSVEDVDRALAELGITR
jgi:hypothetical protein